MKKFLLALFAVSSTSAAKFGAHDEEMQLLWGAWKNVHAKNYTDDDESHRLNVFVENYNLIKAHNAKNSTVTLGLNHFADLTADEWKSKYTGGHIANAQSNDQEESEEVEEPEEGRTLTSLPSSVDWRTKIPLNVKNQGHCGGCWSFSTTGLLESYHYIKTGKSLSFSEQQLIDCNKNSKGCSGGNFQNGITYAAQYGLELESAYPYVAKTSTCKYSSSKATKVNTGRVDVTKKSVTALMTAIVKQPVSIAIEANQSVFQFYKSGVITSGCGASTDHAVLAVGYTTVNGVKAFIVKNSWGSSWGQKGYVYISASSTANSGKGVCGILTLPSYPK